jgi:hypothetical protein
MSKSEEIRGLIEALKDYRTRSAAAGRLVGMGREAVEPLLNALEHESHEGARWAIVNCLGELRSAQAVPALARCLSERDYQSVAHDALVKIVGRDLGPLPADWLRWAEQRALVTGHSLRSTLEPGGAPDVEDEKLVELALEGTVATWHEAEPGRYAVELPLAGGPPQKMSVVFGSTDHEGAPIAIVYSDCGPASPEDYEVALRRNLRMPYGAIALRDVGGQPCFVMFNTILRAALTPLELRKSILAIGERAHRVVSHLKQ